MGQQISLESNVSQRNVRILLHNAFINEDKYLVEYLIKNKLSDYSTNLSNGKYLIHYLAKYNYIDLLRYILLIKGNNLNMFALTNGECNALHFACKFNNFEMVKFLVHMTKDQLINKQNKSGFTPICITTDLNIIKHLVDNGADVAIENACGYRLIHFACLRRDFELLKYLIGTLKVNCDVPTKHDVYPIHQIAYWNDNNVIRYFIDNAGADLDVIDQMGNNLASILVKNNNTEIYTYLIDNSLIDLRMVTDNCKRVMFEQYAKIKSAEVVRLRKEIVELKDKLNENKKEDIITPIESKNLIELDSLFRNLN